MKDGDNHFNYLYWNHFMEEITGIETREIEGHDDFEVNYNALMTAEERLETDMNVIKTDVYKRQHMQTRRTPNGIIVSLLNYNFM